MLFLTAIQHKGDSHSGIHHRIKCCAGDPPQESNNYGNTELRIEWGTEPGVHTGPYFGEWEALITGKGPEHSPST